MQLEQFLIPVGSDKSLFDDVNKFLRSNRVLDIKKELVNSNSGVYWAICVTYLPNPINSIEKSNETNVVRKEKIDYKNLLTDVEFERFTELRKIRKQLASDDAVPPYAIFTDAELAEIAKFEFVTPNSISKIPGIGKRKVEKYGESLCDTFNSLQLNSKSADEEDRES